MAKKIIITSEPDITQPADLTLIADAVRHVRTKCDMTIEDAAAAIGVSKQSLNDIEKAKPGCRLSTMLKVMENLGIKLKVILPPFETVPPDIYGPMVYPGSLENYMTGKPALAIPRPNDRVRAIIMPSANASPSTWQIAGLALTSTKHLIGDAGLWDSSVVLRDYGITLKPAWAATHERAVFDILFHFCEWRSMPVPDLKVSDIKDTVDLKQVISWFDQCADEITAEGRNRINEWLRL